MIGGCQNQTNLLTIYSVAGTIAKTKHNNEKEFHVTGIYPLNENIFNEDELLSCYITNRLYSQVTEPVTAPSSTKETLREEHQLDLYRA
jgi:hypothetical protein